MKTIAEIKRRALQVLGAVASGQPVSAEDEASIDVSMVAERLADERIADLRPYLNDAGNLPEGLFIAFCDVVAADHAVIFGMAPDVAAVLKDRGERGVARIIRRTRPLVPLQIDRIVGG